MAPRPARTRRLCGLRAVRGEHGVYAAYALYAANLTPDRETGLGAWTDADFIATMRTDAIAKSFAPAAHIEH